MDAKITKERLSRMLSYDWLKIVGAALAAILVWSLIFAVSATRITPAQQFTAINYFGNVGTTSTGFSEALKGAYNDGIFSHEVISTSELDVGGNEQYGSTLMETRVRTSEGDVVFVPNISESEGADTYLQDLVHYYSYQLMNLDRDAEDGFFKEMERYLNHYYDGGYEKGTLNKEKVREDFLARIKKNKDKRYKKSAEIEEGVKGDLARIEKYRAALVEFDEYLASGLVRLETTTVLDHENNDKLFVEGVYSINLCPDSEKMPNLKNIVAYLKTVEGDDGEVQVLSAENMHVALLSFDDVEKGFEYESLLNINYVIRLAKA